jgi:hypothetical protein
MATKTTKKTAAKPAAKTPAKPAKVQTKTPTGDERKLSSWVENPKKVGSASHARYAAYAGSKTVSEFLANGGTLADLKWDSERGYVQVEG